MDRYKRPLWVCAVGGRKWAVGIAKKASSQNSISTTLFLLENMDDSYRLWLELEVSTLGVHWQLEIDTSIQHASAVASSLPKTCISINHHHMDQDSHELGIHAIAAGLLANIIHDYIDPDESPITKRKWTMTWVTSRPVSYWQSIHPSTSFSDCVPCRGKNMLI